MSFHNSTPFPGPAILLRMTGLCLGLAVLGGCATATDEFAHSHLQPPIKLLVYEAPTTLKPARLQQVFAPENKKILTLSDKTLAQAVAHSRQYALVEMTSTLRKRPELHLVSPPPAAQSLIDAVDHADLKTPLSQQTANQLHNDTGADAILRFGITDYGMTPQTWRSGYITFEVVSTLAIAAVIANIGTAAAKGTAGAYLAQETVEETAESYAGFWGLDVVCRPVRIEAQLIQLDPVAIVWQDSDTGLSDVSLSRLTRKVSNNERDQQVDQSTRYAARDLVGALSAALDRLSHPHVRTTPAQLRYMILQ